MTEAQIAMHNTIGFIVVPFGLGVGLYALPLA
jgi:hypothetical protein